MAVRLGEDKDDLPDWKDYAPSWWERMWLRFTYNWKHRSQVNYRSALLWALFLASIAAGVMAVRNLYADEGWALGGAVLGVFLAPVIMWIMHLGDEYGESGFYLTVPAIIIWGVTFLVTRTDSSMWLVIMSVVTLLALFGFNAQMNRS